MSEIKTISIEDLNKLIKNEDLGPKRTMLLTVKNGSKHVCADREHMTKGELGKVIAIRISAEEAAADKAAEFEDADDLFNDAAANVETLNGLLNFIFTSVEEE